MTRRDIVLLGGDVASTRIVYHALRKELPIAAAIVEDRVPRRQFLLRRVRKLGCRKTLGQLLFRSLAMPALTLVARNRVREICRTFALDHVPIDAEKLIRVPSVNSPEAIAALQRLQPAIVVVNGTRIISRRTLTAVTARFINMHAGITPLYRGVHGAYWALVERNSAACGVTVHEVDPGIDTGTVLAQQLIEPTGADNFITYPLLQIARGIPELKRVIAETAESRRYPAPVPAGNSRLWSHPTLFEYLKNRFCLGVR